mmetsp:Transcript_53134/g.99867  ORF Transcript_53134/g.99867 Transcript_53134/m.99867 type:complete len:119 (+) Transcript_53134:3-359(+)
MACAVCRYTPRGGVPEHELEVLEVDAEDSENYPLIDRHWPTVQKFLLNQRKRERKVLVHCYAGMNRSTTMCVAFLMCYENLMLLEAVSLCARRRGLVLTNTGFVRQLVRLAHKEGTLG